MNSEHKANHLHSPPQWSIYGKSSSVAEGCSDHIKSTSDFTPETVWNSKFLIKTAWADGQMLESAKLIPWTYCRLTRGFQVKDYRDY